MFRPVASGAVLRPARCVGATATTDHRAGWCAVGGDELLHYTGMFSTARLIHVRIHNHVLGLLRTVVGLFCERTGSTLRELGGCLVIVRVRVCEGWCA